jgi:hypothetical protein
MTAIDSTLESEGKSALVCVDDPDLLGEVVGQLSEIGFRACTGISVEDLLYKMQVDAYDVVVIQENLGDSTITSNPLLAETLRLTAPQRHSQVVILIGPSLKTGDESQAFQLSVDQVISQRDVANLKLLVRRALTRAQEFYGRYLEAIAASDKADV